MDFYLNSVKLYPDEATLLALKQHLGDKFKDFEDFLKQKGLHFARTYPTTQDSYAIVTTFDWPGDTASLECWENAHIEFQELIETLHPEDACRLNFDLEQAQKRFKAAPVENREAEEQALDVAKFKFECSQGLHPPMSEQAKDASANFPGNVEQNVSDSGVFEADPRANELVDSNLIRTDRTQSACLASNQNKRCSFDNEGDVDEQNRHSKRQRLLNTIDHGVPRDLEIYALHSSPIQHQTTVYQSSAASLRSFQSGSNQNDKPDAGSNPTAQPQRRGRGRPKKSPSADPKVNAKREYGRRFKQEYRQDIANGVRQPVARGTQTRQQKVNVSKSSRGDYIHPGMPVEGMNYGTYASSSPLALHYPYHAGEAPTMQSVQEPRFVQNSVNLADTFGSVFNDNEPFAEQAFCHSHQSSQQMSCPEQGVCEDLYNAAEWEC